MKNLTLRLVLVPLLMLLAARAEVRADEHPAMPAHADPGPVKLDAPAFTVKVRPELLGQHPRIYFTAAELDAIKQKLKDPRVAPMLGWFLHDADATAAWPVPGTAEAAAAKDDIRHSGLFLQQLAFAYVITGNTKYLTAEKNLINHILNWSAWDDFDLGAAHVCFGLSMAYDWLYADFTPAERSSIEAALLKHGRLLLRDPATQKPAWWNTAYFQNHCWICHTAISATALALYDLHPQEMQGWLDDSRTVFEQTYQNIGLDGGYHEGAGYARYGTEWMLYYVDSLRHASGENLFDMPFLRQVGNYFCNTMMPDWGDLANFGDCPTTGWNSPIDDSTLVKLAAEYHDGHLIWLRDHNRSFYLKKNPNRKMSESPFALIWVDPAIAPKPLDDLPLVGLYPDLGLVVTRTSWKDDAAVVAMHCGAPGGQHLVEDTLKIPKATPNNGHTHPDANSYVFWADHAWRVGLPGAYTYVKATHNENTWLVSGKGQRGDNRIWFEQKSYMSRPDQAHLVRVATTPQADYIVGEAAPAYDDELGLTQFTRHLLFVKGSQPYTVAFDQLAAKTPQSWMSYLHTYTPINVANGGTFQIAPATPEGSPSFGAVFGPGPLTTLAQPLFVLREHTDKPLPHGYELSCAPERTSTSTWQVSVVGVGKGACSLVKSDPAPEIRVGTDDIAWTSGGDIMLNGAKIQGNLIADDAAAKMTEARMAAAGLAGEPDPTSSTDTSTASAPAVATGPVVELLPNTGFDAGTDSWVTQKLQGAQATFEVKPIENGKHALCVTVPQAADKRYYVQLLTATYQVLNSGHSYTFSFRGKATPDATVVVMIGSSENPPGMMLKQDDIPLTADWKDYSYTFTPTADSAATHITVSGLAAQAGQYWFTNFSLHEGATGTPVAPPPASPKEQTPASLPGADSFIYRDGSPEPMRLHVFKPAGWTASDHRPALVFYFGGGWTTGTPAASAVFSRRAASMGWVGISPDYRTKGRFGTSPLESVADSRAAFRWVQDHAAELGIDPTKIIVGGHSAGGHVALWTAIDHTPPGSDPNEAPHAKPAALFLLAPVSDTSRPKGYTPFRFGANDVALSPVNQLDGKMPPTLLMHANTDAVVPYRESVALDQALLKNGAVCDFVTVPNGTHGFPWQHNGYDVNSDMDMLAAFLQKNGVISQAGTASSAASASTSSAPAAP